MRKDLWLLDTVSRHSSKGRWISENSRTGILTVFRDVEDWRWDVGADELGFVDDFGCVCKGFRLA